jgi:hypothetical protein
MYLSLLGLLQSCLRFLVNTGVVEISNWPLTGMKRAPTAKITHCSSFSKRYTTPSDAPPPLLAVMDIFKAFPDLRVQYPNLNQCSRVTFAVTFVFFRMVLWLWVVAHFQYDSFRYMGQLHLAQFQRWLMCAFFCLPRR